MLENVRNWPIVKRAGQAFYGWRIVAASGIASALGSGLCFYGFSVFFLPITESLNLSRAATSLVFSLSRAEGSIEGPAAGYLIDRLGPRKVIFAAASMMGIGYILLSKVDSFLTFLLVYMGVISFGFNAGVMHVPMASVTSWFVRRRGLAMGIVMAFMGIGGAFIPPALSTGIQLYGWRTTALLSGLVSLVVIVPLSVVFRRSPESMGLLPDGDSAKVEMNQGMDEPSVPVEADFTAAEALRRASFWVVTLATCLRIAGHMAFIIHFVPIMVWKGTSEPTGAFMLGTMALISIPLRILIGWIGDRFSRARVIALGSVVGATVLMLLNYAQLGWQLWTLVAFMAIGESVGPQTWALVGDLFGRRRFATIRGLMSMFTGLAAAVMPVAAGMIFDVTRSYNLTLWISGALMIMSAIVFAILRPPSRPVRQNISS
ncbi:MAG: MFS transporter [Chloroflexota bacterium]